MKPDPTTEEVRGSSGVIVRAALPRDAPLIADFNRRLAVESEGRELDPDTLDRGVRALLDDPSRGRYWVAERSGEPVGQCLVTTEWSDWTNGRYWWFQSVYVEPAHRGAGVFRALWEHVESAARAAGDVASLRLYVEEENALARAVYEKLGMAESGYLVYEKRLR
jgi:GNAT superfamily N-acetyltransferase